jgi:ATP-dependent Clp protease ATP-binding subunit ClpA
LRSQLDGLKGRIEALDRTWRASLTGAIAPSAGRSASSASTAAAEAAPSAAGVTAPSVIALPAPGVPSPAVQAPIIDAASRAGSPVPSPAPEKASALVVPQIANRPDDRPEVSDEEVAAVVAMWTGIPVMRIAEAETARLLKMEEAIGGRVIGQEQAIGTLSRVHARA